MNRLRSVNRNVHVGIELAAQACGWRSRVTVALLALSLTAKQRTPWARTPFRVRMAIGGREFPVMLATHADLEVLREIVVEGEYDLLPTSDARVIVDLGAHIGLSVLRLLAANPRACVLAVEPDPYLIAQLQANVAGLPVAVVNAAVAAESGSATLYRSDTFSWANSLRPTSPGQSAVTVPCITFDELLADAGISRIDLLKIDIEGAEWDAFPGGLPTKVASVVGELHARSGVPPRDLVNHLCSGMHVTIGRESEAQLVFVATRQCADPSR